MKYSIISAKDLQCGDVIFTGLGEAPGVELCARAIGTNPGATETDAEYVEWRVQVMSHSNGQRDQTTIILKFHDQTKVGIAREDQFVETDVRALLADL